MIKYKKGCLIKGALEGEITAVAHQCNCFCNMGRGIAPQIKRAFPEAWEAGKATGKGDRGKLGSYSLAESDGVYIFNLYGQYEYGSGKRQTSYEHLRKAMVKTASICHKDAKIGLPKIGAGLGGGDWAVIEEIINDVFDGYDVTVYEV